MPKSINSPGTWFLYVFRWKTISSWWQYKSSYSTNSRYYNV